VKQQAEMPVAFFWPEPNPCTEGQYFGKYVITARILPSSVCGILRQRESVEVRSSTFWIISHAAE